MSDSKTLRYSESRRQLMAFKSRAAGLITSPSVLLIAVWAVVLMMFAFGPVDYPGQPSTPALLMVGAGILLFVAGQAVGELGVPFSMRWIRDHALSVSWLKVVVATSAILGMVGIALIAFDRNVLSGIKSGDYAAFLRCAPEFIDFIDIRRTPLIYLGYVLFSFGYASLALFLLRAEEIRGWPAYLAQLSIVAPIGYALVYSGRLPILLVIGHIAAIGAIRAYEGRTIVPRGHHLALKLLLLVVAFGVYTNVMWMVRRDFCVDMQPAIERLRDELATKRETASRISTDELSQVIKEAKTEARSAPAAPAAAEANAPLEQMTATMAESWGVRPRDYLVDLVERGIVPPRAAIMATKNHFYLTHGVMTLDRIWRGRQHLSPLHGVYQVGILSPIIRILSPENRVLRDMQRELTSAKIYGFFPSAWGAAFLDFGTIGGALYILIWGMLGGWSYGACRYTKLATPPLMLSFVLTTVLLSPIQGPLGIANSALVLVSLLAVGVFADLTCVGRKPTGEPLERPAAS